MKLVGRKIRLQPIAENAIGNDMNLCEILLFIFVAAYIWGAGSTMGKNDFKKKNKEDK